MIPDDFAGSVETQPWTRISMNLSVLKSRRTLPKANGRSVPWLNIGSWKKNCIKTDRRRSTLFMHLLVFSFNSCQTEKVYFFPSSFSPCSKHLMLQPWCATCAGCSWALVWRDPVRLHPPVPVMDFFSQRNRRRKRRMTWGMGRRRAVSELWMKKLLSFIHFRHVAFFTSKESASLA